MLQIEIYEENQKLKLKWNMKIQTNKIVKNDTEYTYYRTSFPVDLKKYLNINSDVIFFKYKNLFLISSEPKKDFVEVAKSKLIKGKSNQLFLTLPKKVDLFSGIKEGVNSSVVFSLVFLEDLGGYFVVLNIN